MNIKQTIRLTPEQFKAVVIGKGWTYRELAAYWGITPVWVSNIARNPERPRHYDDAVFGLPVHRNLKRNELRRQAIASAMLHKITSGKTGASRYSGYLEVGGIVTAFDDVGSLAEAGMRGIVFQVRRTNAREEYGIVFETGSWDWFTADYIDRYLALSGLVADELTDYRFESTEQLKRDFDSGIFNFWGGSHE